MGAKSRRKGASGENEVVALAKDFGYEARRSAPMQAGNAETSPDVDQVGVLWIEAKRCKKTPVNRFARKLQAEERIGWVKTLAYRDDGQDWMAVISLSDLLALERKAYGRDRVTP